ncbi:hypothetical protein EVAR_49894_1 [Eumeta japonica]|uniref:Uncharacterized protein n=1 Tax=Eumeta variegata TaxID=151549 RepID=A0A4C1Y484_EUMVA|nr:hypothetical protein EVAR_49894_1 [Eumeta japonica]
MSDSDIEFSVGEVSDDEESCSEFEDDVEEVSDCGTSMSTPPPRAHDARRDMLTSAVTDAVTMSGAGLSEA